MTQSLHASIDDHRTYGGCAGSNGAVGGEGAAVSLRGARLLLLETLVSLFVGSLWNLAPLLRLYDLVSHLCYFMKI